MRRLLYVMPICSYKRTISTERPSRTPIVMLKGRCALAERKDLRTTTPKANHTKPQPIATTKNRPAIHEACATALPSDTKYVLVALRLTNQDFGFNHWNENAPRKPTGFPSCALSVYGTVPIRHASQTRNAAPDHRRRPSTIGFKRMTVPSPSPTTNIISPMPAPTPRRHGMPRATPATAPVAVNIILLGPGVIAATVAKVTNAIACSAVI
jgi:hypothetical protein